MRREFIVRVIGTLLVVSYLPYIDLRVTWVCFTTWLGTKIAWKSTSCHLMTRLDLKFSWLESAKCERIKGFLIITGKKCSEGHKTKGVSLELTWIYKLWIAELLDKTLFKDVSRPLANQTALTSQPVGKWQVTPLYILALCLPVNCTR